MSRVTIVIPTLDRKEFLEQAIESVEWQTYDDIECIVVDDGSTDGTREFLDSLDYDYLRTIYRDETGLSSARNAGIDASEGEYVLFFDSDDILYPGAVETLVEALERQSDECAGVFGSKKLVTDRGRVSERRAHTGTMTEPTLDNARAIGGPSSVLFRHSAIDSIGGFDESFVSREDLDLYLSLLERYMLYGIDEFCCERRIHADQMSRDKESVMKGYAMIRRKHDIDPERHDRRRSEDDGS